MTASGSAAGPVPRAWQYRNKRILIVDDQPELHDDFREMLAHGDSKRSSDDLAAAFGAESGERDSASSRDPAPDFELAHSMSGLDACRKVEEACRDGEPYALAFVDLRMPPGMDGIEAIRRIRRTDRDIEIVIMTAYSDRTLEDIVQGTELLHKMLYVRKPFTREEIQQIAVCLVGKWNVERALASRSRQIVAANRTLEAVLDATDDAMVMFDESGRFVLANSRFEQVCGVMQGDLSSMSGKQLDDKLKECFTEPSPLDVGAGYVVEDGGTLVEKQGVVGTPNLFYRSKAVVRDGRGIAMGRLEVYRNVSRDIEIQRMKGELMRLRGELETTHSFGEIVGGSRRIRELYGLIRQGASHDVTVLIKGETGTGKELVARSFHANSARRDGPFLAVNCAAIPEGLVESELFGHEKGAFTGASATRKGAFERSQGGTLFLDEIGDMKPSLQGRLLRVLQEREFQRVGGSRTLKADVRVVAATNRNLERDVREGTFREDLFYRVSVFPVTIPPLRDRREDVPLLAGHFLKSRARRAGKAIGGISAAAMRLLIQYDWPGNVRELANVVERAVLLETEGVIRASSLPPRLTEAVERDHPGNEAVLPPRSLAAIEREALVNALAASGNNVTEAARSLEINRSTLYGKLKRYGLRPRE